MTYAEYTKIDAINWSRLKAIGVSPLQFQYERLNPKEETSCLRIGLAAHAHVLEPHTFADKFVSYAGTRRGKAWDEIEAHAISTGKVVLSEDETMAASGAAAAILSNPIAVPYLHAGLKEAVFTWTDSETGLKCKGRLDHAGAHLVDIKTAARMGRRTFASAAARLGYHSQLAFYGDGLAANGIRVEGDPIMIAVQSQLPHDVIVYVMPPHVIEVGRQEYRRLLVKLAECMAKKEWPGAAPDGPVTFELPGWATIDDEALELTMGGVPLGGI